MSYVDFTSRAVETFRKAASHDEAQEYAEAYRNYIEAIDIFMTAIKYEKKNDTKREMLRGKVKEILERAEKIKEYLNSTSVSNDTKSGTTSGLQSKDKTKKSTGNSNDDEDEKSRFRSGLETAIVHVKPNVPWSSIAGLDAAKDALREAVILPVRFPQLFKGNRKPWRAILLYGPPGTGKSYLAKAVATESDSTFFSVSSADLMSRWVGDSEKLVRTLFEMARKSSREQNATSIIFIDEIDSMCSARGDQESDATKRMKTEFLVQMQGVSNDDTDVLVLAATNIPWGLDSAIRRRFEKRIYIPLPDAAARAQMLRIHLGKTPHTLTEEDFTALAAEAEMYSGSDMHVLVRNAMMESIRTLQLATHFKYIRGPWTRPAERTDSDGTNATGDESTVSEKTDGVRPVCMMIVDDLLFPCAPNDPNGFPMELLSISDPSKVVAPSVCYADFLKAMRSARPSVCTEDLTQHLKFTQDFGQEG